MAFVHMEGPSGPLDSCKQKIGPHFFIGPPPYTPPPPPAVAPLPLVQSFKKKSLFVLPPLFYTTPPLPPPPLPLTQSIFFAAILDFNDVKNMTERRGPDSVFYVDKKNNNFEIQIFSRKIHVLGSHDDN